RVFVLGSLNGHMDNALKLLRKAGIIDHDHDWKGDAGTVLVQTGNMIGEGPDAEELLKFFLKLTKQANERGGRVIQLLGNNELRRVASRLSHAVRPPKPHTPLEMEGSLLRRADEADVRLLRLPIAQRVGDTVFVHGGIAPFYALMDIGRMNQLAKNELPRYIQHPKERSADVRTIFSSQGPVDYRLYSAYAEEKRLCKVLRQALGILKVKRMVASGRLQRANTIFSRCNG
ncbi:Metallo-dependent phosphatase-like protein, partial [Syncephalis pseudoplumigaleata]